MNRNIYPRIKNNRSKKASQPEAAQPSQYAMSKFIQSIPVPICVFDREEGIYLEINDAFCQLLGLSRSEILYHRDRQLPRNLGHGSVRKIITCLYHGGEDSPEILVFNGEGKLVRCQTRVEGIVFGGRECVMVSLTQLGQNDARPRNSEFETRLSDAIDLSRAIVELETPAEIYNWLAAAIYRLLPEVSSVFISHYDDTNQFLTCDYADSEGNTIDPTHVPLAKVNLDSGNPQDEVVRTQKPVVIDNLDQWLNSTSPLMRFSRPGKLIQSAVMAPLIIKSALSGIIQVYSYKPARFRPAEAALLSLLGNTAAVALQNTQLSEHLERTSTDLSRTYEATIEGWMRALELRDFSTERHTHRVANLTVELGQRLGLDDPELLKVRRGAQLHDIGKMGIPDSILLKPGALDDEEWRLMRKHPVYAYELLRPIPHLAEITDIPYCHHEKWDGSGYPRHLSGEDIPLAARIFAVVDVWDALSSHRPYRAAWAPHQVVDYIQTQSNKHFESEIAGAFIDLVKGKNYFSGGSMVRSTSRIFLLR